MWTTFMDMHSGGDRKENFAYCYIEAPRHEAEVIFQNRFGHNPNRVTCTHCGPDYSISEYETLEQATAFNRGCDFVHTDIDGNEVSEDKWYSLPLKRRGKGYYAERPTEIDSFFKYEPLPSYLAIHIKYVLVIREADIKPEERIGELKQQGYIWHD